jgi:hypothetical protein
VTARAIERSTTPTTPTMFVKWYEIDPETHAKTYYIEEDVVSYGGSGISISWVPAGHARPSQVLMSYTR